MTPRGDGPTGPQRKRTWLSVVKHPMVWALLLSLLLHVLMLDDFSFSLPATAPTPNPIEVRLMALSTPAPIAVQPPISTRRVHTHRHSSPIRSAPVTPAPTLLSDSTTLPTFAPNPVVSAMQADPSVQLEPPSEQPKPTQAPEPSHDASKPLPSHLELQYSLMLGEHGLILGRASYVWMVDANRYTLVSITEARGLLALFQPGRLEQISIGHLSDQGLVPDDFAIQRGDNSPAHTTHIHLDYAQQQATVSRAGNSYMEPLPDHAQDILSVIFQLALFPPTDQTSLLNVSSGKAFKPYHAQVFGEEILQTPLGALRTLHVSRPSEHNEDGMDIWFAEDLNNIPVKVRIQHSQYGDFEQVITGIR